MSQDVKDVVAEQDPWDVGMITERLPAHELWEDGIEPEDESQEPQERAA